MTQDGSIIEVQNVSVGYDGFAVQKNLNFTVRSGEIFIIMGGSGCGKSTLLKHMIGLYKPLAGDIRLFGESIVTAEDEDRRRLMRKFGVTYQAGALFGSFRGAKWWIRGTKGDENVVFSKFGGRDRRSLPPVP